MPKPAHPIDPEGLSIKTDAARQTGAQYAEKYQAGEPYPYIYIDDFLPEAVIDKVYSDLEELPEFESDVSRTQENLKPSYNPDPSSFYTRGLIHDLNSRLFIQFLEDRTGIKGLIPDPYFIGAGIHKTLNGEHLDILADFNLHQPLNLKRRLNVLIYLNRNWQED